MEKEMSYGLWFTYKGKEYEFLYNSTEERAVARILFRAIFGLSYTNVELYTSCKDDNHNLTSHSIATTETGQEDIWCTDCDYSPPTIIYY